MQIGTKPRRSGGFTIVELLIVIVVIGILAAIALIAYNGIQNRAKIATVQTDLESSNKLLESYKFSSSLNEKYPADLATAALKSSTGTSYTYQVNNASTPAAFCLSATNGGNSYYITNTATTPASGTCSGIVLGGTACPSGFITVPGSTTFSTSDFCVMKYEAKITGQSNGNQTFSSSFIPESRADGTPWVNISQTNAIAEAPTVAGCTGCHLITENEWLTIAQNVIGLASNWSGGAVGSGYIYSGHNDNSPASALAADSNDANGYSGTGNSAGETVLTNGVPGNAQKRTFTLSNGEVIWDFSGNVLDWTQGVIAPNGQPGLSAESAYSTKEYNNGSLLWNALPVLARPASVYPGAGSWSSTQGIGALYSNYGDTVSRSFNRGGYWNGGPNAGVLSLNLNYAASTIGTGAGFRVAR